MTRIQTTPASTQRPVMLFDCRSHRWAMQDGYVHRGIPVHHVAGGTHTPSSTANAVHRFADHRSALQFAIMHDVQRIINGSEYSAAQVDRLNAELELPGHDPQRSLARVSKWHMGQLLAREGLRSVEQQWLEADSDWSRAAQELGYPLVVKPEFGMGSLGVTVCREPSAFFTASTHAKFTTDVRYVLEQFIPGTEYQIDMMSVHGQHYLTHAWKIVHTELDSAPTVYSAALLLRQDDPIMPVLRAYTASTCQALGYYHGISHAEVKVREGRATLVESQPRAMGASLQSLRDLAYDAPGDFAHTLAAAYLAEPDHAYFWPHRDQRYAAMRVFIQARGYKMFTWDSSALHHHLPRHVQIAEQEPTHRIGSATTPTRSLSSSLAQLGLLADSDDALIEALHKIRELEIAGMFER